MRLPQKGFLSANLREFSLILKDDLHKFVCFKTVALLFEQPQ